MTGPQVDLLAALTRICGDHPTPRPLTWAEREALAAAEDEAEYRAEYARGVWLSESDEEWLDRRREDRELRAAEAVWGQ